MTVKKLLKMLLFLLLLATLLSFIFGSSSKIGADSAAESRHIMELLKSIFHLHPENSFSFHVFIRKFAHLFEFCALGILLSLFIKKNPVIPFLLGVVCAFTDECIQYFIPDRSASLSDVLLDSIGIAFGVFLVFIFRLIISIFKKKNKNR